MTAAFSRSAVVPWVRSYVAFGPVTVEHSSPVAVSSERVSALDRSPNGFTAPHPRPATHVCTVPWAAAQGGAMVHAPIRLDNG